MNVGINVCSNILISEKPYCNRRLTGRYFRPKISRTSIVVFSFSALVLLFIFTTNEFEREMHSLLKGISSS